MTEESDSLIKCCAIAVMAKAPQPGRVKTRLVPPLTPDMAMALSSSFLRDITENIQAAARDAAIHAFVAYAPAGQEYLFDGILAPNTKFALADGVGDMPPRIDGFGRCLLQAAQRILQMGYGSVCLLNSDSPTLPTSLLRQAAAVLARDGDRAVLGPAEDGGYYLIGMKAAHAPLFEDIAWSTDRVADETRMRARASQIELVELAPWYDVDDRAALERFVGEVERPISVKGLSPYFAPVAAASIERLGIRDLLANDQSSELARVSGRTSPETALSDAAIGG